MLISVYLDPYLSPFKLKRRRRKGKGEDYTRNILGSCCGAYER
jgi:hypothetical protein